MQNPAPVRTPRPIAPVNVTAQYADGEPFVMTVTALESRPGQVALARGTTMVDGQLTPVAVPADQIGEHIVPMPDELKPEPEMMCDRGETAEEWYARVSAECAAEQATVPGYREIETTQIATIDAPDGGVYVVLRADDDPRFLVQYTSATVEPVIEYAANAYASALSFIASRV